MKLMREFLWDGHGLGKHDHLVNCGIVKRNGSWCGGNTRKRNLALLDNGYGDLFLNVIHYGI